MNQIEIKPKKKTTVSESVWVDAHASSNRETSKLIIANWPSLGEEQTTAMT